MADRYERAARAIADGLGIRIGGDRAWDVRVNDARFYRRVLSEGSLGLGESYMDGWWDCDALDVATDKALRGGIEDHAKRQWPTLLLAAASRLVNRQSRSRASRIADAHYDLGNDLFAGMLDKRLVYSCGYWRNAETLDDAQVAKLDLVCRKIGLARGDRVLDIGCGWGGFARYAAEAYGARVVGVTVAREQAAFARDACRGLDVEIRLEDYRAVAGTFDHVVSIGMFEHVGPKNHRAFFEVARRVLPEDGLLLLHTIGNLRSRARTDPWFDRYIFPGGVLPSIAQIGRATERLFVMEDWHNFGPDYDRTLMAWHANVERAWPALAPRYGERFRRMWRLYLLSCAGMFRSRKTQLWQIVLSPRGVPGGYETVR